MSYCAISVARFRGSGGNRLIPLPVSKRRTPKVVRVESLTKLGPNIEGPQETNDVKFCGCQEEEELKLVQRTL